MQHDDETLAFLREREERIGGPIRFRSFATWFSEIGGEAREWGVFLYSDGKTLAAEDFFRPGRFLGYEIKSKSEAERERNYVKMEIFLPVSQVSDVTLVSRSSAEKSLKTLNDVSKESSLFNKIFTRNCTRVKVGERVFFFELPSFREFRDFVNANKKGE